jgi:predicted PurR-regulated permease PerM
MDNRDSKKRETRSFMSTMLAIAWSFVGLRRRRDFEQDIGRMNPFYVLIAALIGVAIFIGILLVAVRYAVS